MFFRVLLQFMRSHF